MFRYTKTRTSIQVHFDGHAWGTPKVIFGNKLTLSEAAPAILYGQIAFDALSVHRGRGNRLFAFRLKDHARRLSRSCLRIMLPAPPLELVSEAVSLCVRENRSFIPSRDDNRAFFIRVSVLGTGDQLSVRPGGPAQLWVFGCPVDAIGRSGMRLRVASTDRAAPRGVGAHKLAGNYAPGFLASEHARADGYDDALYLDPEDRSLIAETNTANVIFVSSGGSLIIPSGPTILPSITADSISWLLSHDGYTTVTTEPVSLTSLGQMRSAACVGNATGVRRITSIDTNDRSYLFEGLPDDPVAEAAHRLQQCRRGMLDCPPEWLFVV